MKKKYNKKNISKKNISKKKYKKRKTKRNNLRTSKIKKTRKKQRGGVKVGKYDQMNENREYLFQECRLNINQLIQNINQMKYDIDNNKPKPLPIRILSDVYEKSMSSSISVDRVNAPIIHEEIFNEFRDNWNQGHWGNLRELNLEQINLDFSSRIKSWNPLSSNSNKQSYYIRKEDLNNDGLRILNNERGGRLFNFVRGLQEGKFNDSSYFDSDNLYDNFIPINEEIKENTMNIIVSHNNFMKKLCYYLEDLKINTPLDDDYVLDMKGPSGYFKNLRRWWKSKEFTNLDCLLIVLEKNTNYTLNTIGTDVDKYKMHTYLPDQNINGYQNLVNYLRNQSRSYTYILFFRHCPACHNLDYTTSLNNPKLDSNSGDDQYKDRMGGGFNNTVQKLAKTSWNTGWKGNISNSSISTCLHTTTNKDSSNEYLSGFITEERFSELFLLIYEKFGKNIYFYSSIIFRAMLTCLLLTILFSKITSYNGSTDLESEKMSLKSQELSMNPSFESRGEIPPHDTSKSSRRTEEYFEELDSNSESQRSYDERPLRSGPRPPPEPPPEEEDFEETYEIPLRSGPRPPPGPPPREYLDEEPEEDYSEETYERPVRSRPRPPPEPPPEEEYSEETYERPRRSRKTQKKKKKKKKKKREPKYDESEEI